MFIVILSHGLKPKRYLQVSLDAPNMNLAFVDIINAARSDADVAKNCYRSRDMWAILNAWCTQT